LKITSLIGRSLATVLDAHDITKCDVHCFNCEQTTRHFSTIYQQLSASVKKSVLTLPGRRVAFSVANSEAWVCITYNKLFVMQLLSDMVGDPLIFTPPVLVGSLSQLTIHFSHCSFGGSSTI